MPRQSRQALKTSISDFLHAKSTFFLQKQTPNRQKTFKVLFSILYTTKLRLSSPKTVQKTQMEFILLKKIWIFTGQHPHFLQKWLSNNIKFNHFPSKTFQKWTQTQIRQQKKANTSRICHFETFHPNRSRTLL